MVPAALVLAWVLGAAVLCLRVVAGEVIARARVRRSTACEDAELLLLTQRLTRQLGIRRPVSLCVADPPTSPAVSGLVYPTVALPAGVAAWSGAQRRAVLVHELAHVRRLDAVTQLLARFACAVSWYNPLVWWAAARMRIERERACDDVVLGDGTPAVAYGTQLLALARGVARIDVADDIGAAARLHAARPHELEVRVRALLDPGTSRRPMSRAARWAWGAGAAAVSVVLVAARPAEGHPAVALAVPTSTVGRASGCHIQRGVLDLTWTDAPTDGWNTVGTVDGGRVVLGLWDGTHCVMGVFEGTAEGTFEVDADGIGLGHLPDGASVTVSELRERPARTARVAAAAGVESAEYWVDGQPRPWREGQAWYAAQLARLIRENGLDARRTAARLMARGGLPAVVGELQSLHSTTGRTKLIRGLLDTGELTRPLTPEDRRRLTAVIQALAVADRADLLTRLR